MFMNTFEEKWTAWVDGELNEADRIAFEASLGDRLAAETEKLQAHKLGALLKEQLQPVAMSNPEFFHHQLLTQIQSDLRKSSPEPAIEQIRKSWWTIRRLLWTGATSVAIFVICAIVVIREQPEPDQSEYVSQILNAKVDPTLSPHATVSIFQTKQDQVTVLWVDGLKSLPADYAAK
jgi:hypothetical protein